MSNVSHKNMKGNTESVLLTITDSLKNKYVFKIAFSVPSSFDPICIIQTDAWYGSPGRVNPIKG